MQKKLFYTLVLTLFTFISLNGFAGEENIIAERPYPVLAFSSEDFGYRQKSIHALNEKADLNAKQMCEAHGKIYVRHKLQRITLSEDQLKVFGNLTPFVELEIFGKNEEGKFAFSKIPFAFRKPWTYFALQPLNPDEQRDFMVLKVTLSVQGIALTAVGGTILTDYLLSPFSNNLAECTWRGGKCSLFEYTSMALAVTFIGFFGPDFIRQTYENVKTAFSYRKRNSYNRELSRDEAIQRMSSELPVYLHEFIDEPFQPHVAYSEVICAESLENFESSYTSSR